MMPGAANRVYRITQQTSIAQFESFTIHDATGYFKGQPEHSIIVELVSAAEEDVIPLAHQIARLNDQHSVLVVALSGEAKVLR
jgi:hypothetical protein